MVKRLKRQSKGHKSLNIQATPEKKQEKIEAASAGGDSTTYYVHGPQGIHAQHTDGEWKWMVQDGLGSVRDVVDNDLAVQQSLAYDPIGKPINGMGTPQTMYGYTGEPTDPNELVYLRARYYSPTIGTFISQDPSEGAINDPMSLNGYAYAHGDPVNRTDPSGMFPIPAISGAAGTVHTQPRMSYVPGTRIYDPVVLLNWVNSFNNGCYDKFSSGLLPRTQTNQSVSGLCEQISDPSLYYQCLAFPTAFFERPMVNGDCTPDSPGFDDRFNTGLRSRDINPAGLPSGNYEVRSPARAVVKIVSTTGTYIINTPGNNANLGNFVAIRVHTNDVPEGILQRLPVINGPGFIYLGYAHLDRVSVQVNQVLFPGDVIGMSGNTGIRPTGIPDDSISNAHLDLTMFFVPYDGAGQDPAPDSFGAGASGSYNIFYGISQQQDFYPPATSLPIEIDPAAIWGDQMPTCER